ncbi:MAG TPA: CHAD domain-containing protein [Terriglobales bacterium]|nr:CHAD domain-containing protein [Terriglobales bacterium]
MAVEKIVRFLRQVESSASPGSVHHLRTSIRRLEAELPQTLHADPQLARRLRRLRRRAGAVRDLDVQMALLRDLPINGNGARRLLLRALAQERERRGQRLAAWLTASRRRKLARRLRRLMAAASPVPAEQRVTAIWEGVADLDRRYPTLGPGNLHAFRKDCKHLRYQAEIAAAVPAAVMLRDQLRQVQDAAGIWHDWVELAARARRVIDSSAPTALGAVLDHTTAAAFAHSLRVANRVRTHLRQRAPAAAAGSGHKLSGRAQPRHPAAPGRRPPGVERLAAAAGRLMA